MKIKEEVCSSLVLGIFSSNIYIYPSIHQRPKDYYNARLSHSRYPNMGTVACALLSSVSRYPSVSDDCGICAADCPGCVTGSAVVERACKGVAGSFLGYAGPLSHSS